MSYTRREMLGRTARTGAGALVASTALGAVLVDPVGAFDPRTGSGNASPSAKRDRALFGPLQPGPDGLLAVAPGFAYSVVAVSGQTEIHDGTGVVIGATPDRPDGSLSVQVGNRLRLIQNHELTPGAPHPVPQVPGTVYDPGCLGGGCTVIETDRNGVRASQWVGISGTYNNCAGGPTPWGSWLTCEETEVKAGSNGLTKDHGYVFEVFADVPSAQVPLPITAWGRAAHEAVVVEPSRQRVYLTEDASNPNGLLYRWTAPSGVKLSAGIATSLAPDAGTLEVLAVRLPDGSVLPDLAYVTAAQIGRPFPASWVAVPERQASTQSIRKQFTTGQVTRSKKLEGAWGDKQGMYFVSSFAFAAADLPVDATKHDGQLWYLDYRSETVTLMAYFPYNPILHNEVPGWEAGLGLSLDLAFDGPDGCHVSPYGAVIMTEDGNTANHLLSWSQDVGTQAIARNQIVQEQNASGGNVYSELTGPNFSPDGSVLFANVQEPGYTFALTGPWRRHLG